MIKNPLTGKENNVVLEREISSSVLEDAYKKELGMDVSRFFKGTEKVSVYTCLDTGYQFYHPKTTAGDDSFYQDLEKFPWYYMDWKWEHGITAELLGKSDKVLEIGCARGGFIKKMKEKGVSVEGLELNSAAIKECKENGLTVYSHTIEEFSTIKPLFYDVVCSFQVLEHIYDVKSFIEASLAVLKPGGRMIISVPNNDSFILKKSGTILNMPPHHMGLWNMHSLIQLQHHFPCTLEDIQLEPVQTYHVEYAKRIATERLQKKLSAKTGVLGKLIMPLMHRVTSFFAHTYAEHMIGQTILAVYTKK